MLIRRETAKDLTAVRSLVGAAFGRASAAAEPIEVDLLDSLRASEDWLPALSLVAETTAGDVIGHVVCSRAVIDHIAVVGLGPLAVRPDHQGEGVGSALMHAVLAAAEALDIPAVVLLGSPDYYRRFGFRSAAELRVQSPDPDWGHYFQVRPLGARPCPEGAFRYAAPFREPT